MLKINTYKCIKFEQWIERIWLLQNTEEEAVVISPPDQYINLVIPLNNSVWEHNSRKVSYAQLEGLTLKSTSAVYPPNTQLLGLRFYPYALAAFTNINGKDLLDNTLPFSEVKEGEFNLQVQDILEGNMEGVENYIAGLWNTENMHKTEVLRHFYQYFRWEHQAASIEAFCEEFGTNYTSLNRKFSKVVGLSAKRFERLIKFRKALCDLSDTDDSLTSIGMDSGYFDQSHFIREFKLFMNYSPKVYNSLIREADKHTKIINYNFNLY